jgi:hypothetical protein
MVDDRLEKKASISVLKIEIEGHIWKQVEALNESGPDDPVYQVVTEADGSVWIVFGDGQHGRRLPTGGPSIQANYRYGAGGAESVVNSTWQLAEKEIRIPAPGPIVQTDRMIHIPAPQKSSGCLAKLFPWLIKIPGVSI